MENFSSLIPKRIDIEEGLSLNRTTIDSADDNIKMVWANMERLRRFPWANEDYKPRKFHEVG